MWASGWSRSSCSWAVCALLLVIQSISVHGVSFAWGPQRVLSSLSSAGQQISFQTVHTTHVLGSLLDAMEGFVREGDHKAVLVVAENAEVSLETLPTDALHPLVEVMQRAPAQLTLPNAAPLDGSLTQHLDGHGATNVPCVADRRDAAAALQTHSSVSLLVLPLCPTADVSILHHVAQEAEAASRTVTGLFVGSATPRAAARRRAQALQAEQAPPTCDDKCKAQVRALEAFILFVIIVMAISGGTLIMGAVDTPTRFAAPKKDHSAME